MGSAWFVYLLRCRDSSLYCGITNDVKARLKKHNDGTGAKYTRGRGPVELVWKKKMKTPTDARKKEAEIKKLKRVEKEQLIFAQRKTPHKSGEVVLRAKRSGKA